MNKIKNIHSVSLKLISGILALVLILVMLPMFSVMAAENVNVAFGGRAIGENASWAKTFVASNLVDGDINTSYYSVESTVSESEKSFYIVLNQSSAIDSVIIKPYYDKSGFPENFTIKAYTENGWQEVYSVEGAVAPETAMTCELTENVDASAICICVSKLGAAGDKYAIILPEIEVMGTESEKAIEVPSECDFNVVANNSVVYAESATWTDAFPSSNLIDGNTSTQNHSNGATADAQKEIYIVLKETYTVDEIVLYKAAYGFPEDFKINVYTAEGWKEIYSKTGATSADSPLNCTFDKVDIRAIHIDVTKLAAPEYALGLGEVMAIGTESLTDVAAPYIEDKAENKAMGSTVYGDSIKWANGYEASKAIDGSVNTYFYGVESETEDVVRKVYMTFSETQTIGKVILKPYSDKQGFPVDFNIKAYTAEGWKEVYSATDTAVPETEFACDFEAVDARAICLEVTKLGIAAGNKYSLRLAEIEVMGNSSFDNVITPIIEEYAFNAALDGTVYAECPSWAISIPPQNLIDNSYSSDNATYTTSTYEKSDDVEKIVFINLNSTANIGRVDLYSRATSCPVDFTIEAYTADGWKQVYSKTGATAEDYPMVCEFAPLDAAALTLNVTKLGESENAGEYALQLKEIRVLAQNVSENSIVAPDLTVSSDIYTLADGKISGIARGTDTETFKASLNASLNLNINSEKDIIATGDIITANYKSLTIEKYKAIVKGDVDGDGQLAATDLSAFRKHLLNIQNLTDVYLVASDVCTDNNYNILDLVRMKKIIAGIVNE